MSVLEESVGRCQFVDQPCFKKSNICRQSLEGSVKQLVKEYRHTEELARKVALYNCKLLAPYCTWKEDYHYPIPDLNRPRNKCRCGEDAFWWDGEKSMCFECITKQEDYRVGHVIGSNMTLEEEYGKENK